jgi:hypothetical protein
MSSCWYESAITIAALLLSCLLCRPASALEPQPSATDTQTQTPGSTSGKAATAEDNRWHFSLSPYLWFAGAHGTVGALHHDASIHASPGDLLSHFDFGLMGAAEARRKRFLLNGDLLWIRISDSHALPFPGLGATSADVRAGQLVWTSKLGYRVIDKKVKADAKMLWVMWAAGKQPRNWITSLRPCSATRSAPSGRCWRAIATCSWTIAAEALCTTWLPPAR